MYVGQFRLAMTYCGFNKQNDLFQSHQHYKQQTQS